MLGLGVRSAGIPVRAPTHRLNERIGRHLERLGLLVRDDLHKGFARVYCDQYGHDFDTGADRFAKRIRTAKLPEG